MCDIRVRISLQNKHQQPSNSHHNNHMIIIGPLWLNCFVVVVRTTYVRVWYMKCQNQRIKVKDLCCNTMRPYMCWITMNDRTIVHSHTHKSDEHTWQMPMHIAMEFPVARTSSGLIANQSLVSVVFCGTIASDVSCAVVARGKIQQLQLNTNPHCNISSTPAHEHRHCAFDIYSIIRRLGI